MPEQKESAQAVAQAQNPEANASTSTVNYTTQSPECQLGELSSLEAIESFLRAQAEERILRARQALADARGEIEKARAEREKAIQAKRAEVAQKEEEKKSLRPKVQDLIARAEAILTDDEMATKVVARIIEAGEKEKKALQHSLRGHKAALRRLEAHHAEATEEEELRLALLQKELERAVSVASDVAAELEQKLQARQAGVEAIHLAREGRVEEAKDALARAQKFQAEADLLEKAQAEIAQAERKEKIRAMIEKITACDPERPGALKYLDRLEKEAQEKGIHSNVISFINQKRKAARKAASQAWAQTRRYAAALELARPGKAIRASCGKVEVWAPEGKLWVLEEIHTLVPGGWNWGKAPRRVTAKVLPRGARVIAH